MKPIFVRLSFITLRSSFIANMCFDEKLGNIQGQAFVCMVILFQPCYNAK
jgi:hypothetical protein